MKLRPTLLLLMVLVTASHQYQKGHSNLVEVRLQQGTIAGQREEAPGGRTFYSFKGIPFARPPVGNLRFKDPEPAEPWIGVRDGTVTGPKCPQFEFAGLVSGNVEIFGQEDCLYLNVFTPRPYVSDLPVMVYIHGGSFMLGDIQDIPALPLLTRDVVFVALQYRLGTLGFLSTEDSTVPGNQGLKDQTLALRWVQENIRNLGGDPSNVTIFGISAGGASTHFQILSPKAAGLFNRAILQSGSAHCAWATRKDHRIVAGKIGHALKCPGVGSSEEVINSEELLPCLQNASLDVLVPAVSMFMFWGVEPMVMMPRVDGDFLPDEPAKLMVEGRYNRVDLMTGVTENEGAITTRPIYAFRESRIPGLENNLSHVGPALMSFRDGDEDPAYLSHRVFLHYLGKLQINEDIADQLTELFGDRSFKICHDETAELHALDSTKKVYMYELKHRGQHTFFDYNLTIGRHWIGHADDFQYLFDYDPEGHPLQEKDDLVLRRVMLDLWVNFARTGNPTPTQSLGFRWERLRGNKLRQLALKPVAVMEDYPRYQIKKFWSDLPTQQNKILYPEKFSQTCEATKTVHSPKCF